MFYESYEDFQYDSCVSRGICSLSPRTSALQTVLVLYLRLFAKYAKGQDVTNEVKDFILNTLAITIYNPEFNENSFLYAVEQFKVELPKIMQGFSKLNPQNDMEEEKAKALEIFQETEDIIQAIKYGEKMFRRGLEEIPTEIRDLYNIILVIAKSISINILDLESFAKASQNGFELVLELLTRINLEDRDLESLKAEIYKAAQFDNEILRQIREAQEERYGDQGVCDVSYSTTPGKAVLVVGSNIRELETTLEALKEEEIDVYTHDDMMLAHTFPKFKDYPHLKGQFGQGVESCLLDFATFPGPIILTKHSLHNIENLYRGRLFTTDYTSPKGVIKIVDNDFKEVIESALSVRGFKTGKQCETVTIGYDYKETINNIRSNIESEKYEHIFFIGLDGYSLEQKIYFEKLIKLAPQSTLILSFSYDLELKNLIHINTCFDSYSMIKIFNGLKSLNIPTTVFVPRCERNSVSHLIYLSEQENTNVYVGKCTPIILNPSLMNTLQSVFGINGITTSKKDLETIFADK